MYCGSSFPNRFSICLSCSEGFSQTMVRLTGWQEWCTCTVSSQQKVIWCKNSQILRVVTYCCRGSCVESLLYKTNTCTDFLVRKASVAQDCSHDFLAILNQISLKCCAPRGLNFQTIFFCPKSLSIVAFSHSSRKNLSSLFPRTKFVPCSGWKRAADHLSGFNVRDVFQKQRIVNAMFPLQPRPLTPMLKPVPYKPFASTKRLGCC